mmetsp:Transcript_28532/g.50678  ORF Transcript_28532/g.50678 Transcript_28532/m.50678 type:complete len:265 (-) Transcript_28532:640-1434(-)
MFLRRTLAFAAGFLVSAAAVYLNHNYSKKLKKAKVIAVLKDISLKTSGCLITLANFSRELRKQAGSDISDEEIANVIIQHSPLIERIHAVQAEVYRQHSLTEEVLKTSCEQDYKHDRQVQALVSTLKVNFENSLKGVLPKVEVLIPDSITPQFTIHLLELSRNVNVKIASSTMRALIEAKVAPSTNNPEFIEAIHKLDYEFDKANESIFRDNRLDQYEVPAVLLFNIALQRFSSEDPSFKQRVEEIEADFKLQMQMIFSNSFVN